MHRLLAIIVFSITLTTTASAQGNQATPLPNFGASPVIPSMPSLPSGIAPQPVPNDANGLPGVRSGSAGPGMPPMPGAPAGAGARPMPPSFNEPVTSAPLRTPPEPQKSSSSAAFISFLDSTAPYVQALDFVLMVVAGTFCLRARQARGLTILAISCFVSAIILLGFFLFGFFHGNGALPQFAYIVARVLAPFELLLFAVAIILVAQSNRKHSE